MANYDEKTFDTLPHTLFKIVFDCQEFIALHVESFFQCE